MLTRDVHCKSALGGKYEIEVKQSYTLGKKCGGHVGKIFTIATAAGGEASSMLKVKFKADRNWKEEEVDAMPRELVSTCQAHTDCSDSLPGVLCVAASSGVSACTRVWWRGGHRTPEAVQNGTHFPALFLVYDSVCAPLTVYPQK